MLDPIRQTEEKMKKTIETLKKNFAAVRTGRASPALLDHVTVEYYGSQVPIKQMANISVPESRLIVIQPYDKGSNQAIEKAILKSDLGLTPKSEGGVIRLPLPQPTEERRKELVKVVKKEADDARIAMRNVRREAMEGLKDPKYKEHTSEDKIKMQEDEIQKLTDRFIGEVDKLLKAKEAEVMEV
jgi:ribosome recycling factor